MPAAKAQRRIHPDQSLGRGATAAEHLLQLVDLGEDTRRVTDIQLAFRGQAHGAGGAIDQPDTQACLQRGEAFAHRRRGNPQFAGSGDQAAFVGEQVEKRQIQGLAHS
jgi:hypothetical protein